ncbi:hypothetical protein HDU93_004601 [Gonapodya sp. JEL0774]|nr:hypothetical protein HDU93_004601 [Gonapodya sp. JEL0774]
MNSTSSEGGSPTNLGTSVTAVRQSIDIRALANYMKRHVVGVTLSSEAEDGALEVKQFGFGQSNPTYFLKDAAGKRYVMRKKPPGKLVSATAHQIDREYRAMDALRKNSNFPVPQMYCLCMDSNVLGTPFYIMEFIEGRIFASNFIPGEYSDEERRAIWKSCISTLAHLHSISYTDIGLAKFGRAGGYYDRQIRNLAKLSKTQGAVKDVETGKTTGQLERLDEQVAWMEANMPKDEVVLCHGDFKLDNLIFHPTEPRVIGVIDWELSTIGHPLSDLANCIQFQYAKYDPNGTSLGQMQGTVGQPRPLPIPEPEELIQWYCEAAMIDQMKRPFPIPSWSFCIVFAFFRLSVIAQGIAARYAQRQASSQNAKAMVEGHKAVNNTTLLHMDRAKALEIKGKL